MAGSADTSSLQARYLRTGRDGIGRLAFTQPTKLNATEPRSASRSQLPLEPFLEEYVAAQRRCRADPETQQNLERYAAGRWGKP